VTPAVEILVLVSALRTRKLHENETLANTLKLLANYLYFLNFLANNLNLLANNLILLANNLILLANSLTLLANNLNLLANISRCSQVTRRWIAEKPVPGKR
jgi:hypothetical protein